MDNIAQTAYISKGTVYLYLKSKEDLFYARMQESLQESLRLFHEDLLLERIDNIVINFGVIKIT